MKHKTFAEVLDTANDVALDTGMRLNSLSYQPQSTSWVAYYSNDAGSSWLTIGNQPHHELVFEVRVRFTYSRWQDRFKNYLSRMWHSIR